MFTSVDPANQGARLYDPRGWNAYGYVFNNPYKWTDPDGRGPCPANSTADTCVNVTGGGSNGIQGLGLFHQVRLLIRSTVTYTAKRTLSVTISSTTPTNRYHHYHHNCLARKRHRSSTNNS